MYCCEAVRNNRHNSLKTQKIHFCLFLPLRQTASRPYRLSYINALHIKGRSLFRFYENVSPTILKNVVFRLNNNHTN